MAHRGPEAVVTGVTTADHDHVLAFGGDVVAVFELGVQKTLGVGF